MNPSTISHNEENQTSKCGAIILGAGLSSRMGQPKLLLPWAQTTVIGQIIRTLHSAGVDRIVLVTGATHDQLAGALRGEDVTLAFNPQYADGNMVHSLQTGLRALQSTGCTGALLALGDQPQIQKSTVQAVLAGAQEHPSALVLPSFNMKRGHPWAIPTSLWPAIFDLSEDQTMRDFVRAQEANIHYVLVDTPSIFADLDTPEDYAREKPKILTTENTEDTE
jgi:molybdenum cofactor cytidylyltransferase